MRRVLFFLLILLFLFGYSDVFAADPIIRLYGLSDYAATGSAYDPDCPNEAVEVHVYHDRSEPGVRCLAAYSCPWGSDVCFKPNGRQNTGFWCLYRHPVNSSAVPSSIEVAAINKCGSGSNVWANKSLAKEVKVFHNRELNNIFVDKPFYKIGISKRFGAAIVEFYNKRIDPTVNLVQPDPGSAFQAAVFGNRDFPVGQPPDCVGTSDLRYNPTQAGSHCAHPNGSTIISCKTEDGSDCLKLTSYSGKQLRFTVHFKNFYYPLSQSNSYPYQSYDDVWGEIVYTFDDYFVRIYYKLWKTSDKTYGVSFQQLPIAFLTQLTRFTYKNNGVIITDDALYNSSRSYDINDSSDGRWVTISSSSSYGATPASLNNFVTLAFYNKPYKGICPPRRFQMDYLPNDGGVQYATAIQNQVDFQLEKNYYVEFQAYIFPYMHNEILPNANRNLDYMVNTYESRGGLMPDWECNMSASVLSDLNNDGKVDIFDYNILVSDFGKTGVAGFTKSDINKDGKVDIFDYNILISNFGK